MAKKRSRPRTAKRSGADDEAAPPPPAEPCATSADASRFEAPPAASRELSSLSNRDLLAEAERLRRESRRLHDALRELDAFREEARQQQEALIEVQHVLEQSRDWFTDHYDFAPVGYATLASSGVIQEINLTATEMLGRDRAHLVGTPMAAYVAAADRPAFLRHLREGRRATGPLSTEVHLLPHGRPPLPVAVTTTRATRGAPLLQGKPPAAAPFVRMAFTDLTERRGQEQVLASYQERLRSLASELSLTEERERRRIALALHDNLGQVLALARIKLGGLFKLLTPELVKDGPAAAALAQVQELMGRAIQQTRSLTLELSPPVLHSLGLEVALEWLVEQNRAHGLPVTFVAVSPSREVAEDVRILLFQAVRELLNNVVKHSAARHAAVTLRERGDRVEVTVEDDGVGIKQAPEDKFLTRSDGFGLFSLRTRIDHIGGSLQFERPARGGTRVRVNVPADPVKDARPEERLLGVRPDPPKKTRGKREGGSAGAATAG